MFVILILNIFLTVSLISVLLVFGVILNVYFCSFSRL